MEPWSKEWKQKQYEELCCAWNSCQNCRLCDTRKQVVVGDGNVDADIMFIGGSPGPEENKEGFCFVGTDGQLLRGMCAAVGIEWERCFVTNIIGCMPPKNRDPASDEKKACLPRIHELIYLVDPLILVPVGKFALNALAGGRSFGIESTRGSMFSTPNPLFRVTGERNGTDIPGKVFPRRCHNKKVHTLDYDLTPIFDPAYLQRKGGYNPETNEFPKSGDAHKTLDDLSSILSRVQQLNDEHYTTAKMLERM